LKDSFYDKSELHYENEIGCIVMNATDIANITNTSTIENAFGNGSGEHCSCLEAQGMFLVFGEKALLFSRT